jgi:polyisoprenoid-binding protein YceI
MSHRPRISAIASIAIGMVLLILASVGMTSRAVAASVAPPTTQRFVIVPGESTVTYRVDETLFNEGNRVQTAVGTTTAVRGEIIVDQTRPTNSRIGTITIDISQFKSDSDRRDNAIRQRWLESVKYPIAQFSVTEIRGLSDTYQNGREFPVSILGTLTVRNVTRPTTWAATIMLDGTTLTITGNTIIKMTDFGFGPPAILFLKTEDTVRLQFRFVARS